MDKIKNQNSTIKTWSRDDKPREKLLDNGKETLSNSELLAIIISTGTKRRSALDLARDIIKLANNNVDELAKLSIKELITVPGIGEAKAINIVAAIEIGARVKTTKKMDSKIIKSSNDAYIYFRPFMEDKKFEEFWIVTLNQRNKVINKHQISEGGVAATIVDPRKIYKLAIEDLASGIILCHNHPSGALKPSNPDLKLTEKLKLGGGHLDIKVFDHLIISSEGYFSFADEGLI